jgi:hypothetical protein
MERMAEAVPDCDDQALQHFLTNSPWEDQRVVEQVTHDANSLLGGYTDSCLIIDESGMPKKGKKLKARCAPIRVDKWLEQQPESKWKRTCVRDATKGKLWVDVIHHRVWLWDGKEPQANCWHLIVRRDRGTTDFKYSRSKAPAETSYKRLAYMQA